MPLDAFELCKCSVSKSAAETRFLQQWFQESAQECTVKRGATLFESLNIRLRHYNVARSYENRS